MRAAALRMCAIVVGVSWALAGCHAPAPESVLAERCAPISGSEPVRFDVVPNASGTLSIHVEQRGVSIVAQASGLGKASDVVSTQSPVDRFGAMTFVASAARGQRIAVELRSRDSPQIVGEVCFSAQRLQEKDLRRRRAEQAFAAGGSAFHAAQYDSAFASFLEAARQFDGIDRRRAAEARHAMAEVAFWRLARPADAYVLANWALADFGMHADAALRSALLQLEAELLLDPRLPNSVASRERVIFLTRESQRLAESSRFGAREVARLDNLRGFMEFQRDRPAEASRYFEQAASACAQLQDWECFARARQNTASLAEEARDVPAALEAYSEASQRLPEELNPQLSADIASNLGRLQGQAGLFKDSEQSHRTSIRLYASIGDCDGARIGVARLGSLLVQVGSLAEGRTYLTRAASVECRALLDRAANEAIDSYTRQIGLTNNRRGATCSGPLPAGELTSYAKLAVFNALLGLRDAARLENSEGEAAPCLDAAEPYAYAPRMQLRLANAEGTAALQRGDARRARTEFENGIAVADRAQLPPNHENRSLAYLGLARAALLSNRPDDARREASRALVQSSARGDVAQIVDSLQLMAQSQPEKLGDAAAESILSTAAHLIEQVPIADLDAEKRATWLATQHAVFADLTHRFAEAPEPAPGSGGAAEARLWKAFETSERGRSRSLRYAVTVSAAERESGGGTSERYQALLTQLVALGSTKVDEQAPHVIVDALARIAADASATPEVTGNAAALQRRLAAMDASAVEYAAGRDDMLAFVLDAEGIHVVRLGSLREIETATMALYERLRDPEAATRDVRKAAAQVAALVWWPIAAHVKHRRVLVVPDDSLHTVPFAVLPFESTEDSATLLERAEVSVLPSLLFVTRPHADAQRSNAARFELIGDPVFRSGDWQRECAPSSGTRPVPAAPAVERGIASMALPRLPGSRAEVLAIQELAHRSRPGAHVELRLGCEATPEGLRAAAASAPALLHIATHGYVDAYRPRLSALALTPDGPVQGGAAWFDLLDILDTKVDTRLVVLSACDTSRGRLLAGEGVLGPAQAFLQAGAESVIASYWRIADADTAPFMRSFYQHLLVEHLTAADALRKTQLELMRSAPPHLWAAFTLYGWPDTAL